MEERSNDLDMHVALFQRLGFIEKCNKANGVYNEKFEQEHSMILDALEIIRQCMRNPYIQGRSQINLATKSTKVVEDSPLELKEFSSTVEITHAKEVTLPEVIPQQTTKVEDSPLELEEFSSTVKITHANEVSPPQLIPQQKIELEDSPLELKEFSSTVEITCEVTLPEFLSEQTLPDTISTKVDHSQVLTTKDQITHMIGNTNHVDFNYEEFIFGEYFNYSKPMKIDLSLIGTMRRQDYQTKTSFVKYSASLLDKSLQQYLVCWKGFPDSLTMAISVIFCR